MILAGFDKTTRLISCSRKRNIVQIDRAAIDQLSPITKNDREDRAIHVVVVVVVVAQLR
jgi:hypothetical protein